MVVTSSTVAASWVSRTTRTATVADWSFTSTQRVRQWRMRTGPDW